MDDSRFDALTRAVAKYSSRRTLLGAALGGLVAAALGDQTRAAARLRGLGEICRKNGDCASGACGPADRTGRQRCVCPEGTIDCGAGCVAAQCCSSADCAGGHVCLSNGSCAVPCSAGCESCGNRCITTSDGLVCSAGGADQTCNQSNTDCPVGKACSGAFCEQLC